MNNSNNKMVNISNNIFLILKVKVVQSCLTPCNPLSCSPPGSSIHEVFQARIVEWVAISYFRGSSSPRDQTQVSGIAGRFFTIWASRVTTIHKFQINAVSQERRLQSLTNVNPALTGRIETTWDESIGSLSTCGRVITVFLKCTLLGYSNCH